MRFALRASSKECHWDGFDAALYDTPGGLVERPAVPEHTIAMHVGRPVRAYCRCDGPPDQRLQVSGDIDVVPAGYDAAWEHGGPTTFLTINLSSAFVRSAAESIGVSLDAAPIEPQLRMRDSQLQHIGWVLKEELESPGPHDPLLGQSLGTAFAVQLLRRYSVEKPFDARARLSKPQLRRVLDYIDEHLDADLSLAKLAEIADVCVSYFKSLFRNTTGVTAHRYVVERRVAYATSLLKGNHAPLSQIALQAGFCNQGHMSYWMRRVTGATPTDVKRAGNRYPD